MRIPKCVDASINIILPVISGIYIYFYSNHYSSNGFIRNQLPDGLWAYAFCSAILIIWNRQMNTFWLLVLFLIFIIIELLQYLQVIRGTGDILDIAVYFAFSGITFLTNKFYISNPKTHFNETSL
jgi:hypothetical protein